VRKGPRVTIFRGERTTSTKSNLLCWEIRALGRVHIAFRQAGGALKQASNQLRLNQRKSQQENARSHQYQEIQLQRFFVFFQGPLERKFVLHSPRRARIDFPFNVFDRNFVVCGDSS
jgi:hypothetical protein